MTIRYAYVTFWVFSMLLSGLAITEVALSLDFNISVGPDGQTEAMLNPATYAQGNNSRGKAAY